MDKTKELAAGGFTCIVEGCNRPARAKTKPGKCGPCQASDSYHRKHPDAPRRGPGHHGKWKGKICSEPDCKKPVHCNGLCHNHYTKKYWADGNGRRTKEALRATRIKSRYGITLDEYAAMLEKQGGKCAVCGELPGDNVRAHWGGKLCIDHCHDTGKVRGLLCNDCNLAVGYGKTSTILERAAAYLRLHSGPDSLDNS